MSSATLNVFQTLAVEFYSRRLLLHTPLLKQHSSSPASVPSAAAATDNGERGSSFDANVVLILAVLLCALICALGLNSIVRCALRCSNRMPFEAEPDRMARLAQTGLRRKVIRSLPILIYSDGLKLPGASSECAICLSDFAPGERVRVLPKCNHGFHVKCIDRWLMARSSCPTCRQCLFHTMQKASGCAEVTQHPPAHSVIVPLEPEGLIVSYR